MQILLADLSKAEAQTFGLVLLSSGIDYQVRKDPDGWQILVNEDVYDSAGVLVQTYLNENRPLRAVPDIQAGKYAKTFAGLWGSLVILTFHVAISSGHDARSFIQTYGSSARRILDGEWYRSATSLLLHGDYVHLAGNIAGLGVFGTAVCSVMGWGVGWALILLTGMLGNLVNAGFYQTGHNAIGASTAVFGAVGLLSAYQFIKKIMLAGERYQAFLPIGAGFALLAFLGAAVQTDIMGHLFGFLSGLVVGTAYAVFVKRPLRRSYQTGALLLTIGVLAGAWLYPILN